MVGGGPPGAPSVATPPGMMQMPPVHPIQSAPPPSLYINQQPTTSAPGNLIQFQLAAPFFIVSIMGAFLILYGKRACRSCPYRQK